MPEARLLPAKCGGQGRHALLQTHRSSRAVVVVDHHARIVLVEVVEELAARMKGEMPGCRAGRSDQHGSLRGQQPSALGVEAPDQREIQSRIVGDDELARRVGRDHVQMRAIMIADGELSGRIIDGARVMPRPDARPHVRGGTQGAVGRHGEHRDIAAAVVGDEHELARRMHAHVRGRSAGGAHRGETRELHAGGIDRSRSRRRRRALPGSCRSH